MIHLPLYATAQGPKDCPASAHKGLWYDRFFHKFDADWRLDEQDDSKRDWIATVHGPCGDEQLLERYALRRMQLVQVQQGASRVYATDWHFATGLGLPHPVENGFAWHPTLGVPYLTGAAVKGLVRAYIEVWEPQPADTMARWFGTGCGERSEQSEERIDEAAGEYLFFDAVPVASPLLVADIMTPHMGKWYEAGGGANPLAADTCPGDWHEPVPVPFLVAKQARFLFAIAPRAGGHTPNPDDLARLLDHLGSALEWIGAGAKTAVGYGRMVRDEAKTKGLEEELRHEQEKRAKAKRRQNMSPFEQEIEALEEASDNPAIALLQTLEKGHWQSAAEQGRVATRIRAIMIETKQWIPTERVVTNKRKVKEQARCNKVQAYIDAVEGK